MLKKKIKSEKETVKSYVQVKTPQILMKRQRNQVIIICNGISHVLDVLKEQGKQIHLIMGMFKSPDHFLMT